MAKPGTRKSTSRKPKTTVDDSTSSGWTVSTETIEPVRVQPVSQELWRRNLEGLREAFLSARSKHGPLRCPLFQNTTSKADAQRPPFDITANSVSSKAVSYHYFRSYMTTDGKPIYLKHPIVDVNGTPIVDSQGRGLACSMPTKRLLSYCGTVEASARFGELSRRAGRALLGSNQSNLSWIPTDTLLAKEDEDRWVWAIFDLAWQGRHPSLSAERRTWFRSSSKDPRINTDAVYVPYDLHKLHAMRTISKDSIFDFPEEWTERLPGYFISELPDLFQASVDLVDYLIDLATEEKGMPNEKAAATPPIPVMASGKTMNPTDLRVLTTLARMARGFDLEMPPVDQMPHDPVESQSASPYPREMYSRGNVTLSRLFSVQIPHEDKKGRSKELSQCVHFVREVPDLFLELELADMADALKGALVSLSDRGLITSHMMELALPVCTHEFRTSQGKHFRIVVRRLEPETPVGKFSLAVWDQTARLKHDTASRIRWYSLTPMGWEVADTGSQDSDRGSTRTNDSSRGQRSRKPRMKREVAEPLIAEHLKRKPHDTAVEVGKAVGCSSGLVAESRAWRLNQKRLKIAKKVGIDPSAVKLDERTVTAVGGDSMRQVRDAREQTAAFEQEIDERDKELFRRIKEYQEAHPDATPEKVAHEVGCTAGDVERRQATLDQLVADQVESHLEDNDVEDQNTRRGARRKWVEKKV